MSFEMSAERFWEAVLGRLQVQVTRPTYDTWLQGTIGLALTSHHLLVGVPNAFTAEWLEHRMYQLIDASVEAVASSPLEVSFEVRQLHASEALAPASTPAPPSPHMPPPRPVEESVNPRYTFEAFVVSGSNQLAHAAAVAVADRPGQQFNPLFIYSGVGLGKTHLLHAIAQRALAAGRSVRYTSTEQFTNDFISAIREHKTAEFRQRHRQVDLLLIDDIQFIGGKEQTQEGFFHTFNSLHDANRQVVIASDRPPAELPLLTERLRSRFEGGLVADIQHPELETRVAILLQRCREAGIEVPGDVITHLAQNFSSNIRQLEGSLTRLIATAHFVGRPVTVAMAEQVLGPPPPSLSPAHQLTPPEVLETVAGYYQIDPKTIRGPSREKGASTARQVSAYLLSQMLHLNHEGVGAALGGRDPATIRYSLRKIARLLSYSPPFKSEVTHLQSLLAERG